MVPVLKWPEMSLMESMYVFPKRPDEHEDPEMYRKMRLFATDKRYVIRDNRDSTQWWFNRLILSAPARLLAHLLMLSLMRFFYYFPICVVPSLHDAKILFFPEHQLFCHFYGYIWCTDPAVDKFMRRSVRDLTRIRFER